MSAASLWPYVVVVVAGFLPNEVFRLAAVLLARGLNTRSELFAWVRIVATTLLAAVVSRLVYAPAPALSAVPAILPIAAIAAGVASFFAFKRSLILGILLGEAVLVGTAWWSGIR